MANKRGQRYTDDELMKYTVVDRAELDVTAKRVGWKPRDTLAIEADVRI